MGVHRFLAAHTGHNVDPGAAALRGNHNMDSHIAPEAFTAPPSWFRGEHPQKSQGSPSKTMAGVLKIDGGNGSKSDRWHRSMTRIRVIGQPTGQECPRSA